MMHSSRSTWDRVDMQPDVGARLHDLLRQTRAVQQHAERPAHAVQRRDDGVNLVVLVILNVRLFR